MEISKITVKFIVPQSGHTLTQSEDVKVEERIFSKKVWLGVNDSEKNWKEITPFVNRELFGDDESQYRDESAYRKAVKYARDFYEAGVFGDSEDEYYKKLENE